MKKLFYLIPILLLFSCKKVPVNGVEIHGFGAIPVSQKDIEKSTHIISSNELYKTFQLSRKIKVPVPPKPTIGDTIPPTIKITYPWDGLNLPYDTTINVSLTAYDNKKIDWVSFTLDGAYQMSTTVSPYNFTWRTLVSGVHTLLFTVRDTANNYASAAVTVLVNTKIITPVDVTSSHEIFMPPVQNQGSEGSCVPFATTYQKDAEDNKNNLPYTLSTNMYSPEYVYDYNALQGCQGGTSVTQIYSTMQTKGVCLWSVMPYSDQNGCSLSLITAAQDAEAANHKIKGYNYLTASDTVGIKTMISLNHPIAFTISPDNLFMSATKGFVWDHAGTSFYASHCITMIGYDDVKRQYKIINSWGTGWGDNGYTYISYDYFPKIAYGLFTIENF